MSVGWLIALAVVAYVGLGLGLLPFTIRVSALLHVSGYEPTRITSSGAYGLVLFWPLMTALGFIVYTLYGVAKVLIVIIGAFIRVTRGKWGFLAAPLTIAKMTAPKSVQVQGRDFT